MCGALVAGIMGVEAVPALYSYCEHRAKLPEHTHEEGGFSYDFPLRQMQISSISGTATAVVTDSSKFTFTNWSPPNFS